MGLASPGSQCPCCRSTSAGTPWACHQPSEMNHHSTRTVGALPCFSFLCLLLCMDAHDSELMILQFGDFLGSMTSPPSSSSFIIPYANRSLKTYINTLLANTLLQDGLKISIMPILLHMITFSLGPNPFVRQSASYSLDFTYFNFNILLSRFSLIKKTYQSQCALYGHAALDCLQYSLQICCHNSAP